VRIKLLTQAADAYIERVNKAGGVNGRQIRVVRADSGNKPDKTKVNVKKMVEEDGVFAMWGISGTGNVAVALPYLTEKKVPLIGSTSGADPFYEKTHPMLINLKAGYGDEIRRIMDHLKETYVSRVGILYLDNGFGKEALKTALAAAGVDKLEVAAVASVKEDSSDLAQAVAKVAKLNPPAVLLLTLAGPAPKLVQAYLAAVPSKPQFFALSIVAPDALYKAIGDGSRGVVVTQVVPFPWDRNVGIVREYQDLLRAKGVTEFSTAGMEGFVLARGLVEGLQAAGRAPTREGLIRAFEQMRERDLGGLKLAFSPENHNGSRFIELTMIGRDGRLVR
jgi:ABC-type branched-subunit amino acid transport system substrate-binding protein